jgi:hypothetical protein
MNDSNSWTWSGGVLGMFSDEKGSPCDLKEGGRGGRGR